MSKRIVGIILSILIILSLFGCGEESALDKYYYDNVQKSGIEESFQEATTILEEAMTKYEKQKDSETIDWIPIENKINEATDLLNKSLKKVKAFEIQDDEVKEVNQLLIISFEDLIKGYELLLTGLKNEDEASTSKSEEFFKNSQESIVEWQEKLNN